MGKRMCEVSRCRNPATVVYTKLWVRFPIKKKGEEGKAKIKYDLAVGKTKDFFCLCKKCEKKLKEGELIYNKEAIVPLLERL